MMTLVTLQFSVYAMGWALAAALLREARLPATLWALAAVIQAAAMQVMVRFQVAGDGVARPASMLFILAYVCSDIGIDAFVNRRVRWLRGWVMIGLAAEVLLAAAWFQGWPLAATVIAYTLALGLLLIVPLALIWRPLAVQLGPWGQLALVPGGVMALFVMQRLIQLALDPASAVPATPPGQDVGRMAVVMVAAGAFNLSFVALIVGRLVTTLRGRIDTDALSGLTSRVGLQQRLAQAWQSALRFDQELSVAFVDIDDFKRFNDTFGHEFGDRVIQHVASVLMRGVRTIDSVGRWGGDEFVIVMPQTDAEGARRAMRRIGEDVRQELIADRHGSVTISISVGVASRRADDEDFTAMLGRADAQMYADKRGSVPQPARHA